MMVLTRRERVLAACFAALQAEFPDLCRNRRTGADAEEVVANQVPDVNMVEGGHTASYDDVGDVSYTLRLDVDVAVAADADAELGPLLNATYARALGAVMADISLDGTCEQVRETSLDVRLAPVEESAKPFAEFTLGLEIDFRTPDGDPTG